MEPIRLPNFTTLEKPKDRSGFAGMIRSFHALDVELTEKYLGRTPLYSAFWAIQRQRRAIRENAKYAHGRLLDVGCGLKPYEGVFASFVDVHIGLDYSPESGYRGNKADVCGDAMLLPFDDNCFDTILCTELMAYVSDPVKVVGEFARIMAPGGTLITTAPFVWPGHDRNDYFRFSPDGMGVIMRRHGLEVERVVPTSGTAVTLAVMINLYWYDYQLLWKKWLYPIGLVLRPLWWLLCIIINLLGGIFEVILPDQSLSFSHLTVARKPHAG